MIIRSMWLATALIAGLLASDATADVAHTFTPYGRQMIYIDVSDADYAQVVLFWPGATALDLPGKEGIGTLGPMLPFESAGGHAFPEINESLNDEGTLLTLSTSLFGTTLVFQPTSPEVEESVRIARDLLAAPDLTEEDLARLKNDLEGALSEESLDPTSLAALTLGHAIAGHDRRISALTNRPFEVVSRVTTSDVRDWMAVTFHSAPLIVAAGPWGPEALGAMADDILGNLPPPATAPAAVQPIDFRSGTVPVVLITDEASQSVVLAGIPLPTFSVPSGVIVSALVGGDGARLFIRLREELGATYGMSGTLLPLLPGTQMAIIGGAVPTDRAAETVRIIREELTRLADEGITQAELDLAKSETRFALGTMKRDPSAVTVFVSGREIENLDPAPNSLSEELEGATLETVNIGIAHILAEPPVLIVTAPNLIDLPEACVVQIPEQASECFE